MERKLMLKKFRLWDSADAKWIIQSLFHFEMLIFTFLKIYQSFDRDFLNIMTHQKNFAAFIFEVYELEKSLNIFWIEETRKRR